MANTNLDSITEDLANFSKTEDFTAEEIVGMMTKTHRELEEELFDELGTWNADGEKKQMRDDIRTLADLLLLNPSVEIKRGDYVEIIDVDENRVHPMLLSELGLHVMSRKQDEYETVVSFFVNTEPRQYRAGTADEFVDAALSLNEYRVFLSRVDKAMRRYSAGSADYIGDIRTA